MTIKTCNTPREAMPLPGGTGNTTTPFGNLAKKLLAIVNIQKHDETAIVSEAVD